MLDTEAAETLMSLSAPDEHQFANPLYAEDGLPWHTHRPANQTEATTASTLATSLPNASFLLSESEAALSLLQHARPLTALLPDRHRKAQAFDDDLDLDHHHYHDDDDMDSDVDMDLDDDDDRHGFRFEYASLDGLVAAADRYGPKTAGSSQPISIPAASAFGHAKTSTPNHKWSLSRVKEDASSVGRDNSPTGVEDDAWFERVRGTEAYQRRARLASVCSSEGSTSDYGGLGRKHLEEFIRMEISAAEGDGSGPRSLPSSGSRCIGSYSPEARRRRIERFLEKRKHRVWAKKVDYDVRKNFANSRLRVKGRFVKKEDEELLCELLSLM